MNQVTFNWMDDDANTISLTVTEGKPLILSSGGPTDEGYSYTVEEFALEGDYLHLAQTTKAQDCDGRIEHYSDRRCHKDNLAAHQAHINDTIELFPLWEDCESSQRDYSAEAMNY